MTKGTPSWTKRRSKELPEDPDIGYEMPPLVPPIQGFMHSSRTWVRDWTYFVVYYHCFCTTCVLLLKFMFYQKTLPRNYCASLYVNHFHCSNLLVCKTVYIIACSPTTKSCVGVTLLRRYYIVVISSLMSNSIVSQMYTYQTGIMLPCYIGTISYCLYMYDFHNNLSMSIPWSLIQYFDRERNSYV